MTRDEHGGGVGGEQMFGVGSKCAAIHETVKRVQSKGQIVENGEHRARGKGWDQVIK